MPGPNWVSKPCLCSELSQVVTAGGPSSQPLGWHTPSWDIQPRGVAVTQAEGRSVVEGF